MPEKFFSSAGWQPARRDVAKKFVSSAGWQPAEALCAGKALFVCGLAARPHGVMWRKSSFRLRAGSPQRPYVPEKLVSSAGWQPAWRDVAK